MVRFDEMLDGIVTTTKNVAKAAGQKTSELVEMSKLKYQKNTLVRDLEKAYAKLGAIVYEAHLREDGLDGITEMTMDEITRINSELDLLEKEMEQVKEKFDAPLETESVEAQEITITPPWEEEQPEEVPEVEITEEMKQTADAISLEVDEMADEIISKLDSDQEEK